MPITLGANISSLQAQRRLDENSSALNRVFERLSSGMRINSAGDDAAGLSIASGLNSSARVYTQGIRNVNDALSLLAIADGALTELSAIAERQLELAEQAANGTYSLKQRQAMNLEANALVDEFNRIVGSTTFNGINVLTPDSAALNVQAGTGSSPSMSFAIGESLSRAAGTGTFGAEITVGPNAGTTYQNRLIADLNGDGHLDIINDDASQIKILMGNGDGSFKAQVNYTAGNYNTNFANGLSVADFNGDGVLDVARADGNDFTMSIFIGNGDGTFKARSIYTSTGAIGGMEAVDVNRDGYLDILGTAPGTDVRLMLGNGNGSFKVSTVVSTISNVYLMSTGDFNQDGNLDMIAPRLTSGETYLLLGNGDNTFRQSLIDTAPGVFAAVTSDFNNDGIQDFALTDYNYPSFHNEIRIYIGNADGTFKKAATYAVSSGPLSIVTGDINNDGYSDLLPGYVTTSSNLLLGRGDGTFAVGATYTNSTLSNVSNLADFNEDGVLDAITSVSYNVIRLGIATETATEMHVNLATQSSARDALNTFRATADRVSAERAHIGAFQSRLSIENSFLSSLVTGYRAAESRIMDADVAADAAELVGRQILQQAAASILAQANQQPSLALALLSGGLG